MLGEDLQNAGGILGGLGLPGRPALSQDGVHLLGGHLLTVDAHDLQLPGRDVDMDEVALLYQGDGPAVGGLGGDVADGGAGGGAGETAVSDEGDGAAQLRVGGDGLRS